ncbi:SIMPL domain-containing protein [Agrococcus sp. ARC_14]|uniref:SIMPL domain-containing protein n=1 Tax=Agrococcus sp. ARC_14 TaxID=2919927 RepID=UPI001F064CC9|nr:SIMPL domain-containing protein [Agrococcus sp. ARC_14]MCH1883585.1 SIMPL domain-containing protein [Agrococcus sp. ARC_14]
MVEITVCGTAVERASAERATVTVQSRWSAPRPDEAMRAVAEAHERLITDAKGHESAGAAESWHADRVWISHHEEWVGEGQPRRSVYTAAASVTVRFRDFEVLGTWIGVVGLHQTHEVGGIAWSLSEETERERAKAARTRAIADAVERAGDYASAAGLGAPVVDAIQEPGTTPPAPPRGKARMATMAMESADAAPAVSLEAGELEVRAAVEVRFVADALRHVV